MLHEIMGLDRALPWLIGALSCGYLIGSIPVGLLIAQIFGLPDPRTIGSGNIGATNVLRTGNRAAAAATLLLDGLKGLVPVILFLSWGDLAAQMAGAGAFIGHCFPVWLRFRGGKGVATFLGVVLGLYFPAGALTCLTWLVAAGIFRISSAAALASSFSAAIWLAVFERWEAVLVVALITVIVWIRHSANIRRLLDGTEPRIGQKK
ncbi:MAG: glycerol-3-phosphate 1-O-acyltransferase PlsY [Pseudomonadota bacterium]